MSPWLLLLLCGLFLLLPAVLQFLIVLKHRREHRVYSVQHALDHHSKLAGSFSLVLAVIALLSGAFTQRDSEKSAALFNKQTAENAQEQRQLLHETVESLGKVSGELKVNGDASVSAAHSLEIQLHNEAEMEKRKPVIQVAVGEVDPAGGEGTLIGMIRRAGFHTKITTRSEKDASSIIVRLQIGNFGNAALKTGSLNLTVVSLDGLEHPTIDLENIGGMSLGVTDDKDSTDVIGTGNVMVLPFSNLATRTMKDFEFRIRMQRPDHVAERRFKLSIDLVGDAPPLSGVVTFDVRFGFKSYTELTEADADLDSGRYREALEIYSRAAERGNAAAMRSLAFMYEGEKGIPRDCKQAVRWYQSAIALGDQIAMSNLGWLYERGLCFEKPNYVLARTWYEDAAHAGGADGMANLGFFYMYSHGSLKPNYEAAQEWLTKAILLGNGRAMFNLGFMYEQGWGLSEKSPDLALALYRRSAKAGYKAAPAAVERLGRQGH
jgi:Sel1 repeat-containing protein